MANITIGLNPVKAELYKEEDGLIPQILVSGLSGTPKAPTAINATGTVVADAYEEITANAAVTRTLPAGATGAKAFLLQVDGAFPVTVARTAPNTIEGATTYVLLPGRLTQFSFVAGDWKVS